MPTDIAPMSRVRAVGRAPPGAMLLAPGVDEAVVETVGEAMADVVLDAEFAEKTLFVKRKQHFSWNGLWTKVNVSREANHIQTYTI